MTTMPNNTDLTPLEAAKLEAAHVWINISRDAKGIFAGVFWGAILTYFVGAIFATGTALVAMVAFVVIGKVAAAYRRKTIDEIENRSKGATC